MTIEKHEPVIGIGIASKKLGVSPELLRLYERRGLVIPYKTKSGHRLYSDRDLDWIECFRRQITEYNMNLAGIRQLLALMPCWDMKSKCTKKDCKECKAYKNATIVCWTLTDHGSKVCREESCRDCIVYNNACSAGKLERSYIVIEDEEKN